METEKKYKLTDEFITLDNRKLYCIEALKNFSNVKKGDKGGFVEYEDNLSQYGDCWIYDDAKVYGNARVFGNAEVYEYSLVYGDAWIYGNAQVHENAMVCGNAQVNENAMVCGNAKVYGNTMICENAKVYGNAEIYGDARIYGEAKVNENAKIYGNALIYKNAIVCENAKVYEFAIVDGNAKIGGDAKVLSNSDYIVFKNWWSSGRYFTWTRSNNMWAVGCFYGTGEELIKKAYKDSELSGREYERVVKYVESILKASNTTTAFNKIKQCLTKFLEKFKLC